MEERNFETKDLGENPSTNDIIKVIEDIIKKLYKDEVPGTSGTQGHATDDNKKTKQIEDYHDNYQRYRRSRSPSRENRKRKHYRRSSSVERSHQKYRERSSSRSSHRRSPHRRRRSSSRDSYDYKYSKRHRFLRSSSLSRCYDCDYNFGWKYKHFIENERERDEFKEMMEFYKQLRAKESCKRDVFKNRLETIIEEPVVCQKVHREIKPKHQNLKSESSSPDKVIIVDDDSDEDTIPHRRDFVQKTSKPVNDQDKIHGILKTKKSVRFLANLFEEPVEKKEDVTKKSKNSSSPINISVSDRKRKFELDNNIEVPPKLKAKMAARRKSFESVRSLFENACDFDNLSMISNISTASTIKNENIPRKAVDPTPSTSKNCTKNIATSTPILNKNIPERKASFEKEQKPIINPPKPSSKVVPKESPVQKSTQVKLKPQEASTPSTSKEAMTKIKVQETSTPSTSKEAMSKLKTQEPSSVEDIAVLEINFDSGNPPRNFQVFLQNIEDILGIAPHSKAFYNKNTLYLWLKRSYGTWIMNF
uniref:Uncharacterized protein n=1 Tax=Megaselia scalaris TaxID=36166 RepID=T1GDB1_MEGSC